MGIRTLQRLADDATQDRCTRYGWTPCWPSMKLAQSSVKLFLARTLLGLVVPNLLTRFLGGSGPPSSLAGTWSTCAEGAVCWEVSRRRPVGVVDPLGGARSRDCTVGLEPAATPWIEGDEVAGLALPMWVLKALEAYGAASFFGIIFAAGDSSNSIPPGHFFDPVERAPFHPPSPAWLSPAFGGLM